jgi:protein-disulfide isomerase
VVLVAGALIATAAFSGIDDSPRRPAAAASAHTSTGSTPPPGPASDVVGGDQGDKQPGEMARRTPNDPTALGPVDAPVAIVVYDDFQCPYCAMWSHDTLPTMRKYADAGKLRIEARDLNVFGPASTRAAKAAYAAGLQGKYWAYHDKLYAGGKHRSADELSKHALTELADSLGLDHQKFVSDYGSQKVKQAVDRDIKEGTDLGVMSTPSFLVDGKPIVGAQPTKVFVSAVESALADH